MIFLTDGRGCVWEGGWLSWGELSEIGLGVSERVRCVDWMFGVLGGFALWERGNSRT